MSEEFSFEINWECTQHEMRRQIKELLKKCKELGKVITLPLASTTTNDAANLLKVILSQVNCEGCDAPCCKTNVEQKHISILPQEAEILIAKYGYEGIIEVSEEEYGIEIPCRFLKNNRCSIYPDRPFICCVYPFQPGGSGGDDTTRVDLFALASLCPESHRIAKGIFMTHWRLRQQLLRVGIDGLVDVLKK